VVRRLRLLAATKPSSEAGAGVGAGVASAMAAARLVGAALEPRMCITTTSSSCSLSLVQARLLSGAWSSRAVSWSHTGACGCGGVVRLCVLRRARRLVVVVTWSLVVVLSPVSRVMGVGLV
jgi:hypothetical protein